METERIKYTITFLSDWHAGSGLSSGAEADAVVIKDKQNLPYLPGKTIKGLLKDVLEDFTEVQPTLLNAEFIKTNFGKYDDKKKITDQGTLFFSNAELAENECQEITTEMSHFLYHNIASTSIGENGIANPGSLRTMEVCIPLTLVGYIDGVNKSDKEILEMGFRYLRHLGSNRNRGLGRCKIQIKP